MGEAISKSEDRVLWNEVKKMTKTNNKLPNIIDDHNNPIDITNVFSDKYKSLYNSVGNKIHEICIAQTFQFLLTFSFQYTTHTQCKYTNIFHLEKVGGKNVNVKQKMLPIFHAQILAELCHQFLF